MGRANSLLDYPRGLSDEERDAIYNRAFEGIKRLERPQIQSAMDRISRMGLLGSPFAEREVSGIQRAGRELLGQTERDISIEETSRRFNELMQTSQLAQQLMGAGMSADQIAEALSAGRRGEAQSSMQMLLNYFATISGGQNNLYQQAILNRIGQSGTGTSGGSILDWLPYLAYLGGSYLGKR
jgi:hypothetical protein